MKQLSPEEQRAVRRALYERIESGDIGLAEAVREMRLSIGMTRAEFAERVAGVSIAALAQIETGGGNPTVETLEKIGRPFGLRVAFVRR